MKNEKFFQRDCFINEIYKSAKKNKNIFFLSADFGAPALDIFRQKLPNQFIHTGISEQNMIDIAIGLSLKKKIVINYAMAPFVIARAWEQHKISSLMNLPMINLIPGIGYGYANAGPTHYSNEDLGLANLIVNSNIFTTSDGLLSTNLAKHLLKQKKISFVRLDRDQCENINYKTTYTDIKNGYRVIYEGGKLCIISHGNILNKLYKLISKNNYFKKNITLIDLFRCKPISDQLITILKQHFHTLVFDEQYENFNLSTMLLKFVNNHSLNNNIVPSALKEYIDFGNDGRENILDRNNLSTLKIIDKINKYL